MHSQNSKARSITKQIVTTLYARLENPSLLIAKMNGREFDECFC